MSANEQPFTLISILQCIWEYTEYARNCTSYGSEEGHYGALAKSMAFIGPYSLAHKGLKLTID